MVFYATVLHCNNILGKGQHGLMQPIEKSSKNDTSHYICDIKYHNQGVSVTLLLMTVGDILHSLVQISQ